MNTKKFPLDFDNLKKGNVIPEKLIEEIYDAKATDLDFWRKRLNLRDRIEREMAARGKPVTVAQRLGDLIILTDPEASNYNHGIGMQNLRRFQRRTDYMATIDTRELNAVEKKDYYRKYEIMSLLDQAVRTKTKEIMMPAKAPKEKVFTPKEKVRVIEGNSVYNE